MAQSSFVSELLASLQSQAIKSVRAALEHYAAENRYEFGVQAGIGVENLAKLVLARVHPSLIVKEDRSFQSLLLAAGWTTDKGPMSGDFRTIGAVQAVERVSFLHPTLARYSADLKYLAEVRNGVAHIGLADSTRVEAAVSGFVGAVQIMAKILGMSDDDIFGQLTNLASQTAATAERSVARIVTKKIAVAETRIEKLQALGARAYEALLESLSQDADDESDEAIPIDCPVCGHEGVLQGYVEHDPWEYEDRDSDGNPLTALRRRWFDASRFECRLCGVKLEGWRQVSAAGINPQQVLEEERTSALQAQEAEIEQLLIERRVEGLVDLVDQHDDSD